MMRSAFSLGRLGPIELRVDASWTLAVPLIAYLCMRLWFPAQLPGLDAETNLAMGLCAALLVFLSVVLHELAHLAVASARKRQPRAVVLLVFGGVWVPGEAVPAT